MKRKRINHQVDIFCEMFSGWRLVNDLETLVELKSGRFDLNLLERTLKLNNEPFEKGFHMLHEISDWFDRDLTENQIDKKSILVAELEVDFVTYMKDGKPKSKTRKVIEIKLDMNAKIQTEDKLYGTAKNKVIEYQYIKT
jgi:hypothetical protein